MLDVLSNVDFSRLRDDLLEILDPDSLTWSIDIHVLSSLALQCLCRQVDIDNNKKDKIIGECLKVLYDMGYLKNRGNSSGWYIS